MVQINYKVRARSESPTHTKTRILVVDDHPVSRKGVIYYLSHREDFEVCGEAEGVADAKEQVEKLRPDLVLADLSLKGGSGLDLIRDVRARFPNIVCLVLSMYDETAFAERSLSAGSKGYVVKKEGSEYLVHAIHEVLEGRIYLSEEMKKEMLEKQFVGAPGRAAGISALSGRELEVFQSIGRGETSARIADNLHLSIKTIETHRAKIKAKLGLKNNMELIQRAIRWQEDQV